MTNLRRSHTSHNNCVQNNVVEVTVIIPTLNEEKTIATCIQKIKKVFKEYNIKGEIIVSDSSTDKTPQIAKKLGAKVVHPDRRGYGYAYIYAFKHAKGKYIIMGDGDNTYDFLEIPKLLKPLKNGEADLVIGSRLKGKVMPGAMPWLHRYIGNPLLTGILNLFFKIRVSDAHCGFRAIKKDALQKLNLKTSGMEFASEMLIEAKRKNLKISEVPIVYYPRQGQSKLRSFKDGWRHLKYMLIQAPNWLYILPANILFILGALLFILGMFKINIGYIPGTYSMVIGSLVIILSLQIAYLGIFSKLYGEKRGYFESRMSSWIKKHLDLEKGILLGLILLMSGLVGALYLVNLYISIGYQSLPLRGEYMIAFTLIIIGIQIIFYSFTLSMLMSES